MRRGNRTKFNKINAIHRRLALLNSISTGTKGWVLAPIHSEREEWSECVREKKAPIDQPEAQDQVPEDSIEEFDDLKSGM